MTEETEEFPLNEKLEESIQKKIGVAYEVALKECNKTFFWDKGVKEVADRELNKNLTQEEKQYSKEKDEHSAAKFMKMLSDTEKEKQNPVRMDYNEMRRTANHINFDFPREKEQKEYRENIAKIAENTTKIRKAMLIVGAGSVFITLVMDTLIGILIGNGDSLILSFIKYLWLLITT